MQRVRYATAARETLAYRGTMANAIKSLDGIRTLAALLSAMRPPVTHWPEMTLEGIRLAAEALT